MRVLEVVAHLSAQFRTVQQSAGLYASINCQVFILYSDSGLWAHVHHFCGDVSAVPLTSKVMENRQV